MRARCANPVRWKSPPTAAPRKRISPYDEATRRRGARAGSAAPGPRLRWAADVQSPGYVRLDVSARYRFFDHWSVYGRIENVLDMKIIEELGYKQPRMFGIGGIEYSFY